ncbi:hypothetical protein BDW69DRAFT_162768 [Aspergillus filifer]
MIFSSSCSRMDISTRNPRRSFSVPRRTIPLSWQIGLWRGYVLIALMILRELASPRCKLDRSTPEKRETKHIFLQLDELQSQIEELVARSSADGAWSENGQDITNSWLRAGLKPRSITRDMKWGHARSILPCLTGVRR